ncbi:lamin tail domain-containing protein [Flavobacterium pedocola]
MKKLVFFLIAVSFALRLNAQCENKGSVVISEIYFDSHYNESIDSKYHHFGEYIELFNSSDQEIDLNGWLIKDNHTEYTIRDFYGDNTNLVIQPGGFKLIVFSRFYAAPHDNWYYEEAPNTGFESAIGAREKFVELFPQAAGHETDIILQDKMVLFNYTDKVSLYSNHGRLIHEISYKNGPQDSVGDQDILDYMGTSSISVYFNDYFCNYNGGVFNAPIGEVPVLDNNGNPVLDGDGNPILHMNNDYLKAIYLADPQNYYYFQDKNIQIATATPFSLPFSVTLLPASPFLFYNFSEQNLNWTHSVSYDVNGNRVGESRSYFDDLGKPSVSLSKDFLTDKVWGSETTYDSFGRIDKESFPVASCFGFDRVDFLSEPSLYSDFLVRRYSDNNTEEPFQATATHPYSQNNYDSLNPGNVINVVGGNQINGQWKTGFVYTMPAAQEMYYAFGKNYYNGLVVAQGEEVITKFYKTISIDAHGVENVVFTDGEGKTLATARSGSGTQYPVVSLIGTQGYVDVHIPANTTGATLIGNSSNYKVWDLKTGNLYTGALVGGNVYRIEAVTTPIINPKSYVTSSGGVTYDSGALGVVYNVNYYDYSLNYYNAIGRLTRVVQPKGYQHNTTIVAAPQHMNYSTGYYYDTLGNVTQISSADQDYNLYAYRKDGQIRFSYNDMHEQGLYISTNPGTPTMAYTEYDEYGRPTESGICDGDWYTYKDIPDAQLPNSLSRYEGVLIIYDYPENYSVDAQYPLPLSTVLSGTGLSISNYKQNNLAGNVAITHTFNPTTSTTWYSYDIYGRVEWMLQNITGLGVKTVHYKYDANGNVKKVIYQKDVASEMFVHQYTYNLNGVLVAVETSTNDHTFKKQADYEYYLDGKLKRVNLANGLQGTDYVYTLGGMLKSINHPSLDPSKDPGGDSNDVFGLTIDYYNGDYLRSTNNITTSTTGADNYDGNIKAIRWSNKSLDVPNPNAAVTLSNSASQKGIMYSYNNNKWLTGTSYGNATATTISPLNKLNEQGIAYDKNGNITSLQRTDATGAVVDNLTYNYNSGNNQLLSVTDAIIAASTGEHDLSSGQGANNYQYDVLGRLSVNVKDNAKYEYNAAGLTTKVSVNTTNNPIVKFYYNEIGLRIKKESFNPSVNNQLLSTDYYVLDASGNTMAVYTKPASSVVALNELPIYGASRLGIYNKATGKESYELKDHLGNVRAVIKKPELWENPFTIMLAYADFYSFGEQLPSRTSLNGNYRYAFQGQEKDIETGMEAFQLRLWDGRIGRWLNPDPYGQYHSPYMGMGNNPINKIDSDGGYDTWLEAFGSWFLGGLRGSIVRNPSEDNTDPSKKYGIQYKAGYIGGYVDGSNLREIGIPAIRYHDRKELGVTVYKIPSLGGGGITLPTFNGGGVIFAGSYDKKLLQHERGHVEQIRELGTFGYLKDVGVPSIYNIIENNFEEDQFGKISYSVPHEEFYTETDANIKAFWLYGGDFYHRERAKGVEPYNPLIGRVSKYDAFERIQIYFDLIINDYQNIPTK